MDTRESYPALHRPAPRPGPAPVCGLTLKGSSRMQSRKSADTLTEQNRSSQCRQPQACGCPPCYLADELCQQLTLLFSSEHVKLNHMDFLIFNVADLKKMTISCFEHFMLLTYLLFTLWFIWPDCNLHKLVQLLSENCSSSGHFSFL